MIKKTFPAFLALNLILQCLLFGQNKDVPDFKFFQIDHNNKNSFPSENEITKELNKFSIQPTIVQQKEILSNLFLDDSAFSGCNEDYRIIAAHFIKAFDISLRKKYNKITSKVLDSNYIKDYIVPEDNDSISSMKGEIMDSKFSPEYAFRSLDFNSDSKIDMILFGKGYFGPSAGLAFYGTQGNSFRYLFDCSGEIESIEKKNGKMYIRFILPIIDSPEPQVFVTIVFDYKTKSCFLESKLYYAQHTVIPILIQTPQLFDTYDSVYLRWSPEINNKPYNYDWHDSLPYTLFGNAVAQFPKSAEGYILAYKNDFAFVAFDSKVMYMQSTLHHGLDNTTSDFMGGSTASAMPEQYWCGWIEKKYINIK